MLITLTIINWLLRLLDVYSIILVIYALMSWIPTLYGTWFGRIIVKVSRPYLSLFENLPLQFWGLDFSIVIAFIVLKFMIVQKSTEYLAWNVTLLCIFFFIVVGITIIASTSFRLFAVSLLYKFRKNN